MSLVYRTDTPSSSPSCCLIDDRTMGFPGGSDSKEPTCQCRRCGFDPWVGRIPWRRKWQPSLVFLPGESHQERSLVGYSPWYSRVEQDCATFTFTPLTEDAFSLPSPGQASGIPERVSLLCWGSHLQKRKLTQETERLALTSALRRLPQPGQSGGCRQPACR